MRIIGHKNIEELQQKEDLLNEINSLFCSDLEMTDEKEVTIV